MPTRSAIAHPSPAPATAACVARAPAAARRAAAPLVLLLASALIAGAGCAPTAPRSPPPASLPAPIPPSSPTPAAQESPMTVTDVSMDAEEIGRRVLKLIASLHDARDLAPDRIERETGLPVAFNDHDPNVYGFAGALDGRWTYSLVSTPDREGAPPTSLRFSFDPAPGAQPDPAIVCTPSFEAYGKALGDLGFTSIPMQAYPGSHARYFSRGDIRVTAYASADPGDATARACLSRLIISAGA